MQEPQAEVARGGRLPERARGVEVEQQAARVVPLGRVRPVRRVRPGEAPYRRQLAVLPAARVAGVGEAAGVDVDQRQRVG